MPQNSIRLASTLTFDSIVDGPGLRTVIWTQGCPHHCPECHNPQTHDYQAGALFSIEDIIQQIENSHLQSGVTFSGGEPFEQAKALSIIAKRIKELHMNIWCFSGYLYEDILQDKTKAELLQYIDVLVDGRFKKELKDYRLTFKGSSNQRIIDVQKSLKVGSVVLHEIEKNNIFEL